MKNPSIFFARSTLMLFFPNSSRKVSRTCSHITIWCRLCGCKSYIGNLFASFPCPFSSVVCHHAVHYQATFESGWDCWKNNRKTRGSRHPSGIGISLVPHSNLNSIPFSPFTLGTILIDSLFHCHIYTNI